jgi:hypothetical protein
MFSKGAMRRLTAILGIVALAITIVPSGLGANALDCCNGTMCPMHPAPVHETSCSMDQHHPSAALQPCPRQSDARYTGALVFVSLAPTILHNDSSSEPAVAFLAHSSPDAERRVESPPPRFARIA